MENNCVCLVCGAGLYRKPSFIRRVKSITCSKSCMGQLRRTVYIGEGNPNLKHKLLVNPFQPMSQLGAYILGFLWAEGTISNNTISLPQKTENEQILVDISILLYGKDLVRRSLKRNMSFLSINSKSLIEFICSLGGISLGKKSDSIRFPKLEDSYLNNFLLGFFDGDGSIRYKGNYPDISFASDSIGFLDQVADYFNLSRPNTDRLTICGFDAIRVLDMMYRDAVIYADVKHKKYLEVRNWQPKYGWKEFDLFQYKKLRVDAVAPFKKRVSDSGFDVSVVELTQIEGTNLYKANTHLAVRPIEGWYFDLVGRSGLPLNGWHFVGGVGIIDQTYTGPLVMILEKLDDCPLPELPFRCGQLVPRPILHVEWVEVEELDETDRGSQGFGSSGTK